MKKNLEQRVEEAVREHISLVPYDSGWPSRFESEADFLRRTFPSTLVKRIEHIGSTAVPGLAAKPVIDILVEVSSLEETQRQIVPVLESAGYDYFWRTDMMPPYAWFIKRDSEGFRMHHLHMVESDSELWDRLYFRDYLCKFSDEARRYEALKMSLAEKHPDDRVAYTKGKAEFIIAVTQKAKEHFSAIRRGRSRLSKRGSNLSRSHTQSQTARGVGMDKKNSVWKKGPGKMGVLAPLIGTWKAEADSPMGRIRCTRTFKSILGGKYVELLARWEFAKGAYEETAIYGVQDGKLSFWSFTSDGKRSEGSIADGSDMHPEAICFEAKMPAGLARMVYWPREDGGVNWAVEAKSKKGWKRFTEHHYFSV